MDFSFDHNDADGAIQAFQSGISTCQSILAKLNSDIQQFENGDFTGEAADAFRELMTLRVRRVQELEQVWTNAIRSLRRAQQEARNSDNDFRNRSQNIGR